MFTSSKQAHDLIAGTTNTGTVINVNLPDWKSTAEKSAVPQQQQLDDKQKNLIVMGVVLAVMVIAIIFVSRRKKQ